MNDYFIRVAQETPTRFWINNVTLEEADLALAAGAVGCTQNPTYTWKILSGNTPDAEKAKALVAQRIAEDKDNESVLCYVQRELVRGVAEKFTPLHQKTGGMRGYVSIQDSPLHETAEHIIARGRENQKAGPNIMCKIPVTEEGLKAIEVLAGEGVAINATECMAVRQVLDVCEVYRRATKNLAKPAPLGFSVITGIFDEWLAQHVKEQNLSVSPEAMRHAGMAIAKKVYKLVHEKGYNCEYISGGARGTHNFTDFVGADVSITINWVGTANDLLEANPPVEKKFDEEVPAALIDELCSKIDLYKQAYDETAITIGEYEHFPPVHYFWASFAKAWQSALDYIQSQR